MSKKNLVIVESPTKARTISGFLGSNFVIESSYGHVRDLPKSKIGIDFEHDFAPHYIIPQKAKAQVKKLKSLAAKSSRIILATDEDREGEAIAWHLLSALDLKDRTSDKIERIVFHEITKDAINEALENPRTIDEKLVNAQQARRVLDRIVGYKLSPFLWKKITRGLSAGRVQSVALRFIAEREREIQAFKPQEYWTIEADAKTDKGDIFRTILVSKNGKTLDKFDIATEKDAKTIKDEVEKLSWKIGDVEKKAATRSPFPPFTTSTLQQEASRRLGFSVRLTMMIAQQLYEGIDIGEGRTGLITYMRTDSVNLSRGAVNGAKTFIEKVFGKNYTLPEPRFFKTKSKGVQEAHEAIRPTNPHLAPEKVQQYLDRRQFRLYDLIWRRFIATQMPQAIFDATTIDVEAGSYTFRAHGQIMKFDGFLRVYPMKREDVLVPNVTPGEQVSPEKIETLQHFTEPPARYTDATLIKKLEEAGVGRPSTYAPTLATIQARHYVEKDERKRYIPTEIGVMVNDLLVEHFPEIVDVEFTAKMEEELDEIAEGAKDWQPVIREFYDPFSKRLETKYEEVKKQTPIELTDGKCEKCGRPMAIKYGRFGRFLACTGFPECKNAKPLKKEVVSTSVICPKCGQGELIEKRTKKRRLFFSCSRYPDCDFATWTDPRKKAPVYDPDEEKPVAKQTRKPDNVPSKVTRS